MTLSIHDLQNRGTVFRNFYFKFLGDFLKFFTFSLLVSAAAAEAEHPGPTGLTSSFLLPLQASIFLYT